MKDRRLALILGMSLLAACGAATSDWLNASRENTVAGYRAFLQRHGNDPHAEQASDAIRRLQDDAAWTAAQVTSSIDGFNAYLARFPDGRHASTAQENIQGRKRSYAWSLLPGIKAPDALRAFLARYPSGPESDEARRELSALTGYRAEFATARERHTANHRRDSVARRLKRDAPALVILAPDAHSDRYRLASPPLSEQQVNRLCERASAAGQACWIVNAAS